jgi:hypothetical protein
MPSYANGVAATSTVAAKVVTVPAASGDILVKNLDPTNDIYVGGPGLTADTTATGGWLLAHATGAQTLPSPGGQDSDLYAIASAGTPKLSWIFA